MFKNPEFKSITIKLFVMNIIFAFILFLFMNVQLNVINKRISNQNIALVGNILTKNPSLEDEVINFIVRKPTYEQIKKGKEVLRQYGYTNDMSVYLQPVLKDTSYKIEFKLLFLIFLYFIPLFFLIKNEYSNIYSKVKNLSRASEKMIKGDLNQKLEEGQEGDFSILNHQFNQMSNTLSLNLESLKKDKKFLKNTISDISHQLKTPLSSLIMLNELILTDQNMQQKVRMKFLQKSKVQLERMEWLIINLLKMARLEVGAIQFSKEKVYIIQSIEIALSSLSIKAKNKNIIINVSGDVNNVWFYGDKDWTAEALINIIKNSIEHTQPKGKIEVFLSQTPVFSRICIKDNGEGIDKKDIFHIFERFYKGSSSVKTESIGIGLALSKLIIESQNGTVEVSSQKGVGTEFTITFLKGII